MKKVIKYLSFLVVLTLSLFVLASCKNEDVTGTLKLERDFTGKSFIKDGIGEVELSFVTDGDTATYIDSAGSVTLRYFAVDTPESTGDVDKWGLAASKYAKSVLENAVSIVLESDTTLPGKDDYGRYLGYVWYKATEDSEYRNFNLELVQNGYSQNTSIGNGKYVDYFNKAQNYAKKNNLRIWSNDDDPLFSDTPTEYDLKYINENVESLYYIMVSVEGYVSNVDGNYITLSDYIGGKYYSFTVYFHNTKAPSLQRQGNKIKIVGTVQTYNDKWQISGVKYDQIGVENSELLVEGYYLTFGKSINTVIPRYSFENITVTNVTLEGDNYVFTGTTARLRQDDVVTVTFSVPKTKEINTADYIGKELELFGFNEEGTESDATDISFVVNDFNDIIVH